MNIRDAQFITSAADGGGYPPPGLPEIAFAGRSNVGKSSLINTLVNRKRLVKTSNTPGRTQLINFFSVNDAMVLVDLPGYGYAKVPEAVRRKWGPMITAYLSDRETLRGVVLILDIRRIPTTEDREMLSWLIHGGLPLLPVLTKADKLSKTQAMRQRKAIAEAISLPADDFTLFSAKTRLGREQVWESIGALLTEGD